MTGCTFEELYYALSRNHEIEFVYKDNEYKLELCGDKSSTVLAIYKNEENAPNIAELNVDIDKNGIAIVSNEDIFFILNCKCFDGKSFYDIEKDVEVTAIY